MKGVGSELWAVRVWGFEGVGSGGLGLRGCRGVGEGGGGCWSKVGW